MPSAVSISTMQEPRVLYSHPREDVKGRSIGALTTWQEILRMVLTWASLLLENFGADVVERFLHGQYFPFQCRPGQVVDFETVVLGETLEGVALDGFAKDGDQPLAHRLGDACRADDVGHLHQRS